MKIVADESVDFGLIEALREAGFEVFAVVEELPSIKDREVLRVAFDLGGFLLTEDKDFGELVVRFRLPNHGILLVRFASDYPIHFKAPAVLKVFLVNFSAMAGHFSVLDERRLRIRRL